MSRGVLPDGVSVDLTLPSRMSREVQVRFCESWAVRSRPGYSPASRRTEDEAEVIPSAAVVARRCRSCEGRRSPLGGGDVTDVLGELPQVVLVVEGEVLP